jgi:hypothetical protein
MLSILVCDRGTAPPCTIRHNPLACHPGARKYLPSDGKATMDGNMFAWILILSLWLALCSLILHDATKEDSDGSAILLAAKKIKAFTLWVMLKAQRIRRTLNHRVSHSGLSKLRVKAVPAVSAISSPPEAIRQGERNVDDQAPIPPPKKKWWSRERRIPMTTSELEMAISEAVKSTAPSCEDFVGVIVQRKTPKSNLDPNWVIRGAKFGKADRKIADTALATIVERMQREFLLGE